MRGEKTILNSFSARKKKTSLIISGNLTEILIVLFHVEMARFKRCNVDLSYIKFGTTDCWVSMKKETKHLVEISNKKIDGSIKRLIFIRFLYLRFLGYAF